MDNVVFYGSALLVLFGAITVGYLIVQLPWIRRSFLPASVAAGLVLLLLSPQLLGKFPTESSIAESLYKAWEPLPGLLINVIFAALFLGKPLASLKGIWRMAAPQAAFGQMIAWGYYAVGSFVVLFILAPVFGTNHLAASLLEISFEGGHGTAAGMESVFSELNYKTGQEMAVALATTSLFATLTVGFTLISIGRRRNLIEKDTLSVDKVKGMVYHRRIMAQLLKIGYNLREDLAFWRIISHIILLIAGVLIGWAIHWLMLQIEGTTWGAAGDLKIFGYMPRFTFCMFGGMIAQTIWRRLGFKISLPLIDLLSSIVLAMLVTSAIGTMKLDFISTDGVVFLILALSGVLWVLFCFVFLARHIFVRYWFTNAIIGIGQSMGTTATGLLFAHVVDPKQRTGAAESFGYKQLLFEPFMGGGIVTAMSMPMIVLFGLPKFMVICAVVSFAWLAFGVLALHKHP